MARRKVSKFNILQKHPFSGIFIKILTRIFSWAAENLIITGFELLKNGLRQLSSHEKFDLFKDLYFNVFVGFCLLLSLQFKRMIGAFDPMDFRFAFQFLAQLCEDRFWAHAIFCAGNHQQTKPKNQCHEKDQPGGLNLWKNRQKNWSNFGIFRRFNSILTRFSYWVCFWDDDKNSKPDTQSPKCDRL